MEIEKIEELIEEKEYVRANEALSTMNEADVTEILAACDPYKTLLLFRMLPKRLAAEVFSRFTPEQQLDIVSSVTSEELKDIVNELYFDDKVDLIEEMPANMVKKILSVTGEKERELINQFLNYPEDSAGSLMTIEYVDLKKHMTVRQALDRIKKTGMNKETIYTCYVTDAERRLEEVLN